MIQLLWTMLTSPSLPPTTDIRTDPTLGVSLLLTMRHYALYVMQETTYFSKLNQTPKNSWPSIAYRLPSIVLPIVMFDKLVVKKQCDLLKYQKSARSVILCYVVIAEKVKYCTLTRIMIKNKKFLHLENHLASNGGEIATPLSIEATVAEKLLLTV
ncbi:MAG: hypothetical protein JWM44_3313 [Bacilli bacterium]|nr:hypothetical protein [Bacilli bacterium]